MDDATHVKNPTARILMHLLSNLNVRSHAQDITVSAGHVNAAIQEIERLEKALAEAKGPQIADDWSILLEAEQLTNTVRQGEYGHPLDTYDHIGVMWTGYLLGAGWLPPMSPEGVSDPLKAEDVTQMQSVLKIGRHVKRQKRDNLTDQAGYAKCTWMIERERERREKEDTEDS
jgi:hypothetical protein